MIEANKHNVWLPIATHNPSKDTKKVPIIAPFRQIIHVILLDARDPSPTPSSPCHLSPNKISFLQSPPATSSDKKTPLSSLSYVAPSYWKSRYTTMVPFGLPFVMTNMPLVGGVNLMPLPYFCCVFIMHL